MPAPRMLLRLVRLFAGVALEPREAAEERDPVWSGCGARRLVWPDGEPLPPGQYVVSLRAPGASSDLRAFAIGFSVDGRRIETVDPKSRRAARARLTLRDGACALFVAPAGDGGLPAGARWRLRRVSRFESYATAFIRLLSNAEDRRIFDEARRHYGFRRALAVLQYGPEASAFIRSGFTRRPLDYPDAVRAAALKPPPPAPADIGLLGGFFPREGAHPPATLGEAELAHARFAGLSALCLPCAWRDGRLFFDAYAERLLAEPQRDFPVCLCLSEAEIAGQENAHALFAALAPHLRDARYMRLDGKPVLAVFRPRRARDVAAACSAWRNQASREGFPGLVLADIGGRGRAGPAAPFDLGVALVSEEPSPLTEEKGRPGLSDIAPARYGRAVHAALHAAVDRTEEGGPALVAVDLARPPGKGPRLEPDARFGLAWLEALRAARARCAARRAPADRTLRIAVAIHAFYPDLFDELLGKLKKLPRAFALFVTTCPERAGEIEARLSGLDRPCALEVMDNRGRDVLPFLRIYDRLCTEEIDIVFKVHTKRSPHRPDGARWRNETVDALLRPDNFARIGAAFAADPALGMVGARAHLAPMRDNIVMNEARVFGLGRRLGLTAQEIRRARFFAGSIFAARLSSLAPLMSLAIAAEDFEPEAGQLDGTLAHAVERAFALSALAAGLRLEPVERLAVRERKGA